MREATDLMEPTSARQPVMARELSISAADSPSGLGHRIIRRPCHSTSVRSTGRTTGASILPATNRQKVVAGLGVESLGPERDVAPELHGARLVVSIIAGVVLAADAVTTHRATGAAELPGARGWRRGSWRSSVGGRLDPAQLIPHASPHTGSGGAC